MNTLDSPCYAVPRSPARPHPPRRELRVLMSGRMLDWKAGHLLIEALAVASRHLPAGRRITLTFIGGSSAQDALLSQVNDCALKTSVRFLKTDTDGEYARLLGQSHLYVLPNFNSGACLAAVEVLAAGLPIVGIGSGGDEESVDTSIGVKLEASTPKAAIAGLSKTMLTFLGDPALWETKSRAAQRFAQLHSQWRIHLDPLEQLYAELCGEIVLNPSV